MHDNSKCDVLVVAYGREVANENSATNRQSRGEVPTNLHFGREHTAFSFQVICEFHIVTGRFLWVALYTQRTKRSHRASSSRFQEVWNNGKLNRQPKKWSWSRSPARGGRFRDGLIIGLWMRKFWRFEYVVPQGGGRSVLSIKYVGRCKVLYNALR